MVFPWKYTFEMKIVHSYYEFRNHIGLNQLANNEANKETHNMLPSIKQKNDDQEQNEKRNPIKMR